MASTLWLLIPLFLLVLLFILYKATSISFARMGIPRRWVIPIFASIMIGGLVNIPLWCSEGGFTGLLSWAKCFFFQPPEVDTVIVAVNLGGAIIPVIISLYLFRRVPLLKTALAVAIVAAVAGLLAEVEPGAGITLQFPILPLVSVGVALILAWRDAPAVAFISATIGGLIGVDLVHLGEAIEAGGAYLSIGGRGVFDGIVTTGIIAAFLAGLLSRRKEPPHSEHGLESSSDKSTS